MRQGISDISENKCKKRACRWRFELTYSPILKFQPTFPMYVLIPFIAQSLDKTADQVIQGFLVA